MREGRAGGRQVSSLDLAGSPERSNWRGRGPLRGWQRGEGYSGCWQAHDPVGSGKGCAPAGTRVGPRLGARGVRGARSSGAQARRRPGARPQLPWAGPAPGPGPRPAPPVGHPGCGAGRGRPLEAAFAAAGTEWRRRAGGSLRAAAPRRVPCPPAWPPCCLPARRPTSRTSSRPTRRCGRGTKVRRRRPGQPLQPDSPAADTLSAVAVPIAARTEPSPLPRRRTPRPRRPGTKPARSAQPPQSCP